MQALWRRLHELVRGRQLDRESAEELAYHLESLVTAKREAGLDEAEARRQARIEIGNVEHARERLAEGRAGFLVEQCWRELHYALRSLRREPAGALLSIVTMGIGIGASAVLFALVSGILLRPLPYPQPEQLVRIFDSNPRAGIPRAGAASGNIDDWRRRSTRFDGITGFYTVGRTLSDAGSAEVVMTAQVSEDFFPLFKTPPLLGRTFSADETRRGEFNNAAAPVGADPVAVLSFRLWQRQFGGDPAIVGRSVMLERRPFRVIGVMPAHFAVPDTEVAVWIAWDLSRNRPRDQHYLVAIGRVKPGVAMAEAERDLNLVAGELAREYPATNADWSVRLSSLHAETVGETARVLWVLLAAVGLVLLVACANVALLSLLRGMDRAGQSAVRLALGASSARLLREYLIESSLLAVLGGAFGTLVAIAGLRVLPQVAADLPRLSEVTLDARVLLFVIAVTAVAAVVSGVPPAWQRTRTAPWPAWRTRRCAGRAIRGVTSARRHRRRPGGAVAGAAGGLGPAAAQLHPPARDRAGLRPRQRARPADLPRHGGIWQRRPRARLLRLPVRAARRAAWRHGGGWRDGGADEPARPRLRAAGLEAGGGRPRGGAGPGIGADGHARLLCGRGSGSAGRPDVRPGRPARRPARGDGERDAGEASVARHARGRPASGGGLQHGRHLLT